MLINEHHLSIQSKQHTHMIINLQLIRQNKLGSFFFYVSQISDIVILKQQTHKLNTLKLKTLKLSCRNANTGF